MAKDCRGAACFMAGVLEACYDDNKIGPMTARNINEKLRDCGLENVQIEMD
jgi:hypothetical protein